MVLVFALLLASALSVCGESTQPSFVKVYKYVACDTPTPTPTPKPHRILPTFLPRPEFNVNAYASLDLDMREIQSLSETGG